jgi:acetyl-CoA C-acetyltransferase
MSRDVAVTGTGQVGYVGESPQTYTELANEAAQRAVEDSGIVMEEIDAVVLSQAPEAFMGLGHPERLAVDHVGATHKPEMRIHTGGSTGGSAAQAGYYFVASGEYDNVLVVGAEKIKENDAPQKILNAIWDPITEKPFGLNTLAMTAFQGVRYMHKYDVTQEDLALAAVRNHKHGRNNPHAHVAADIDVQDVLDAEYISYPWGLYDACPSSAGGCAAVISSEETVAERDLDPAWFTGVAAAAGTYFMGDRMGTDPDTDHADQTALEDCTREAYDQAGIEDPIEEFDVAEIYAPFTGSDHASLERLGLAEPGKAPQAEREGRFEMDGEIPVSPSGGVQCANPIAVTALVRVVEGAIQIRGTAGKHQVDDVTEALVTGSGGSVQFWTTTTLSADKPN